MKNNHIIFIRISKTIKTGSKHKCEEGAAYLYRYEYQSVVMQCLARLVEHSSSWMRESRTVLAPKVFHNLIDHLEQGKIKLLSCTRKNKTTKLYKLTY